MPVAAQNLFFSSLHSIVWAEVVFIIVIIFLSIAAHITRWQIRWADYRYCAERLRAMSFLVDLPDDAVSHLRSPESLFLNLPSRDWVAFVLDWLWFRRFTGARVSRTLNTDRFLREWIQDQITYYRRWACRLHALDRAGTVAGLALFALTAIAALEQVLNLSHGMGSTVIFVAIAGPAIAGGLAGVRSHRDHVRVMERYRQCADQLELVARELRRTSDRQGALQLILTANSIMLAEHSDWRITVNTREVGPK